MRNGPPPTELVAGQQGAPSLVILGAPRCGTTALATWLSQTGLNVGVKDSFYLMDAESGLRGPTHLSTHGVDGYLALFPRSQQPSVECAAGYVYQETALEFFGSWHTPPRFAVIVRDPIPRLRSVHRYFSGNLGMLPAGLDFAAYVDALFAGSVDLPDETVSNALAQGRYAEALSPWVARFGAQQIEVIPFDQLEAAGHTVVETLMRNVGAEPTVELTEYSFEPRNSSYIPSSPRLARATAWGRKWIPTGRVRSWGGEKLRRLQARKQSGTTVIEDPVPSEEISRLQSYYREPNRELQETFGVDTTRWT